MDACAKALDLLPASSLTAGAPSAAMGGQAVKGQAKLKVHTRRHWIGVQEDAPPVLVSLDRTACFRRNLSSELDIRFILCHFGAFLAGEQLSGRIHCVRSQSI